MLRSALLFLVLITSLLGSCSSGASLLLPGSGQGKYEGSIRSAAGVELGTFDLRIADSGKATGFGTFGTQAVDIRGVLRQNGVLEAFITESDTQETGEFNGMLTGGALSGTWRLMPDGVTLQAGQWTATLVP